MIIYQIGTYYVEKKIFLLLAKTALFWAKKAVTSRV
jgi:hypothetical protein